LKSTGESSSLIQVLFSIIGGTTRHIFPNPTVFFHEQNKNNSRVRRNSSPNPPPLNVPPVFATPPASLFARPTSPTEHAKGAKKYVPNDLYLIVFKFTNFVDLVILNFHGIIHVKISNLGKICRYL
jgi:hypothetical protein